MSKKEVADRILYRVMVTSLISEPEITSSHKKDIFKYIVNLLVEDHIYSCERLLGKDIETPCELKLFKNITDDDCQSCLLAHYKKTALNILGWKKEAKSIKKLKRKVPKNVINNNNHFDL